jgi:hypothetical protein
VHAVHPIVEILDTLGSLWREELEGEGGVACPFGFVEHVFDVHDGGLEVCDEIMELKKVFVSKIQNKDFSSELSASKMFLKDPESLGSHGVTSC